MAIGQFSWGAIQPVAGAVADRYGARPVLLAAVVLLALGCAVTPFMDSGFGLVVAIGLLTQLGAGGASFSVLIGAAAQRLPAEARGARRASSTPAARSASSCLRPSCRSSSRASAGPARWGRWP
jgi:MFS family permease